MIRAAAFMSFVLCVAISSIAQDDASLTKEFAGMSAKERSKLAKQEVEDAAKDEVYQGLMGQAEVAFKAGRFDEARQHYADARSRRPLNVYPKVKLEDLDALIARQAVEEAAKTVVVEPPQPLVVIATPDTAPAPITYSAIPPVTPHPAVEKTISRDPKTAPPRTVPAVEDPASTPPVEGERTYMEGNAKVLEIIVTEQKRLAVYKKVKHPWGQVYYFKDGESVGQRVWQARFGER